MKFSRFWLPNEKSIIAPETFFGKVTPPIGTLIFDILEIQRFENVPNDFNGGEDDS